MQRSWEPIYFGMYSENSCKNLCTVKRISLNNGLHHLSFDKTVILFFVEPVTLMVDVYFWRFPKIAKVINMSVGYITMYFGNDTGWQKSHLKIVLSCVTLVEFIEPI